MFSQNQRDSECKVDTDFSIEVKNISKSFRVYSDKSHTLKDRVLFRERNKHAINKVLDGISFSVRKGEALGLIGHNGCGKSTTLKLLNRIIYPDSGTIQMHGRISSLIELGAGFHPDMSGRENIYINATIFGLKRSEIDRRLDAIIRFSELEKYIDNPVRTYSSGMYMRLAFAIAINVDADILLVDEILAVGDANFQRKCFDKLNEIKKGGATIVIVSHSMPQIKSICERVLWLEDGKIQLEGEAAKVCDEYIFTMEQNAEKRRRAEKEEISQIKETDPNDIYPLYEVSNQIGIYSRRSGNMKIRFTRVELLNASMEESQTFYFGEEILVRFDIDKLNGIDLDEQEVSVIFNIFRRDGLLCTTFSTTAEFGNYLKVKDLRRGILRIKHNSLGFGEYILDAVIADAQGGAYDCLGHLIEFSVETPHRLGSGIVAMDNSWEFTE